MLNINFLDFKKNHKKKKNQIIYHSINTTGINEIRSLIDNFLNEKNSFVFESVEVKFRRGSFLIDIDKIEKI